MIFSTFRRQNNENTNALAVMVKLNYVKIGKIAYRRVGGIGYEGERLTNMVGWMNGLGERKPRDKS
jgi:predicted aspartyl protease